MKIFGGWVAMIVGIDFGTTSMRVAAIIDGRPVIVENEEGNGATPSAVSFRPDSSILVGATAKRDALRFPTQVVIAAKRLIGRRFEDAPTQFLRSTLPISIVRAADGTPAIDIHGKRHSPHEICAHLFAGLRRSASKRLGADVTQAVVAVPAYYGDAERAATKDAAAAAGIEVLRVVSEPTAAAMFQGFRAEGDFQVAVYDLGGGTFDFSMLEVDEGAFFVSATGGDTFLGGEDFDFRIQAAILDAHALRLDELSPSARHRLKSAAEVAKIDLSARSWTDVLLEGIELLDGRRVDIAYRMSRDDLQGLCQDFIDRTLAICRAAIEEVSGSEEYQVRTALKAIDRIVLVGGSTRLPFVEEAVERFFGKPPIASPRREDAVALGCAIQAGIMSGNVKDAVLLDVLPHPLGVRFLGDSIPMIPRHEFYPSARETEWDGAHDDPRTIRFEVFEGSPDEPGPIHIIGSTDFPDLTAREGVISLIIRLNVDANGKVSLLLRDENSGAAVDKVFDGSVPERRAFDLGAMAEAEAPLHQAPGQEPWTARASAGPEALRILAVATEWRSGAGGLSSLNRSLCQALAKEGHDVRCLLFDPEPQDVQLAMKAGVELVTAARAPGFTDQLVLARKPKLPAGWTPEIIIGHGRITGPAAACLAEDHFPQARRLHIIHMAPDEIEWHKADRSDDAGTRAADRTRIECELARSAAFTAAIGPRLHQRFLNELSPFDVTPICIDPGFDDGDVTPIGPPPGQPIKILVAGRTEDLELKGLDIAASAFGTLLERWTGDEELELVVRGAPAGQTETLRISLLGYAGRSAANIVVRPYDSAIDQLQADLRRASVVLMPSRMEGFGLIGLEAIVAGVPVLLSSKSGIGRLLEQALPQDDARRLVVPVQDDPDADRNSWASAIGYVLSDRQAAFHHAAVIRQTMAARVSWSETAKALATRLRG